MFTELLKWKNAKREIPDFEDGQRYLIAYKTVCGWYCIRTMLANACYDDDEESYFFTDNKDNTYRWEGFDYYIPLADPLENRHYA